MGKHYRPNDASEARRDAQDIVLQLGESRQAADTQAAGYAQRSWTLLSKRYDRVRSAVLYLRQDDPQAAEAFPALLTIARRAAKPTTDTATVTATAASRPTPINV